MIKFKPHPYQEKGIEWLMEKPATNNGGAGNFLDMGLGKTACVLSAFKKLKEQGKVKKMLVVAPLKVIQLVWPLEIRKWEDFCGLSYVVLHGPDKAAALRIDVDIYLINYEGLDWLTDQQWTVPAVICFDELSKMKSWKAKRVKAIKPFLPLFKYRWGLTGTPAPNGYYDTFAQAYMLDLGGLFGKYITHFASAYFKELGKNEFKPKPKPECIGAVGDKLSRLFFRMDGKDWLDLPEEVHNEVSLELPKDLRNQYKQLEKDFITKVEGTTITAVSASALSNKLRQFLSGNVYTNGIDYEQIHTLKQEALADLIEELQGEPLLVGYQYKHEVAMYRKAFKNAVFFEDYKSTEAVQEVVLRWNKGLIPVIFGQPGSVAFGLNLQFACNTICFTTLDFNLDNYLQFIKRVARQGQTKRSVIIHYLTFKGTIDEYVKRSLMGKQAIQESLLDYIKEAQNGS